MHPFLSVSNSQCKIVTRRKNDIDGKNKSAVFIGIGSNLGVPAENCIKALDKLKGIGMDIIKSSSFYETEPHGDPSQNWFVNCVVKTETSLSPGELLMTLKDIEREMGRTEKGGHLPRIIDLDILFFDDMVLETDGLKIPHPLIPLRRFVLEPLVEVEPEFLHPTAFMTVKDLLKKTDDKKKVIRMDCASFEKAKGYKENI